MCRRHSYGGLHRNCASAHSNPAGHRHRACDRLVRFPDRRHGRFRWDPAVAEYVAFPTPLAGSFPIGFPGTPAASVPLERSRPEPSEAAFWRVQPLPSEAPARAPVELVLANLLAHWGYEHGPTAVSEILAAPLLSHPSGPSVARPTSSCVGRTRGACCARLTPYRVTPRIRCTHLHWQCGASPSARSSTFPPLERPEMGERGASRPALGGRPDPLCSQGSTQAVKARRRHAGTSAPPALTALAAPEQEFSKSPGVDTLVDITVDVHHRQWRP